MTSTNFKFSNNESIINYDLTLNDVSALPFFKSLKVFSLKNCNFAFLKSSITRFSYLLIFITTKKWSYYAHTLLLYSKI